MNEYRCGTCGTTVLVIASSAGSPWQVSCDNGHVWYPAGGDAQIEIDTAELTRLRQQNDLLEHEIKLHLRQRDTLLAVLREADRVLALAQEELKDPAWDLHTMTFVAAMMRKARTTIAMAEGEPWHYHVKVEEEKVESHRVNAEEQRTMTVHVYDGWADVEMGDRIIPKVAICDHRG